MEVTTTSPGVGSPDDRSSRIGIVTDSTAQLPPTLIDRFGVEVVPIVVSVDGVEYADGVELSPDRFWEQFNRPDGTTPEVVTSQPSPGAFIDAYRRLADAGAEEIVSIHIAEAFSGTINSARLAAGSVDVPVRLVDTGSMSFGVACCVWEAAEVAARGGSAAEVEATALAVAATVRTSFIVQATEFAAAGGRTVGRLPETSDGVAVMVAGPGDRFEALEAAHSVDDLCDLMAAAMESGGQAIRVGVSLADPSTGPFADGLHARLTERDDVVDIVQYRVGAAVGAHTGPGTAGGYWYPVPT